MMQFEIPKERPSIIKVIGVGGGGSNAVNHMFRLGIKGVDFMICNTDHQALEMSPVPLRVQLGPSLTDGRGAGSIPEIGKNAAIENLDEVRAILSQNTKMVFITAGMGGGTGTGAAPIIAGLAKEMGILTVGIVTIPFAFEGKKRKAQADAGIEELKKNVDTLLVICNDRLREIHGNLKLTDAFIHADDVLAVAAKSIAETITKTLHINVDFADVQTVLKESGVAIMGSASAEGDERAMSAIMTALDSPLLNDNNIEGARYILLNITSGTTEVTMDELGQITDFIQEQAGNSAEVIMGVGTDESLGNKVGVTVIATGFKTKDQLSSVIPEKKEKVVYKLMDDQPPVAEAPVIPAPAEVTGREWASSIRPEPIIAEKTVQNEVAAEITPAPEPEKITLTVAVSEMAAQPVIESRNEEREVAVPFQMPPVMFEPQPVDEIDEQPTAAVPVAEVAVSEFETPVIAEEEIIVHQLIREEPVAEVEVPTENDGFVLRVLDTEESVSAEDNVVSADAGLSAPEMEAAPSEMEEAPVFFNLFEEEEANQSPVVAEENASEPRLITRPADVVQEEENTFVFELNMPAVENDNNHEDFSAELESEMSSASEVPSAPLMEAVPPVESAPVNAAPPVPAYEELETEENGDAFHKARARIMQLRELSMKMNSTSGLADLEKEPAYKRRNIQLNNLPQHGDPQISRYTLSNDQENKPEIRPNNPFLHDRVD